MAKNKASEDEKALTVLDYGDQDGAGFEGVDETHLKIPFLSLLQDMSDEVKESHDKYIDGAKPGMLMNSVTKELYPEGIEFIPACVDHCFVEWIPRKRGGGFVQRHAMTDHTVKQAKAEAAGKLQLSIQRQEEDGSTVINDLIETFYIAGALVTELGPQPMILAATSSKIGPYKAWMTRLNMFTIAKPGGGKQRPPLFAHRVKISSFNDSNTKGDFANLKIEAFVENDLTKSLITDLNSETFLKGKEVRQLLGTGEATFDYESQNAGTGTTEPKSDEDF